MKKPITARFPKNTAGHNAKPHGISMGFLYALVGGTHRAFDIVARVYFLAWVKDVVRVKDVFGNFEQIEHRFVEHLG